MTMTEFCNNNKLLPIRLSVYCYANSGQHPLYGRVTTTVRDIEMLPQDGILPIQDEKGKSAGSLSINQFKMDVKPSFVEYLKSNWKVSVSIIIDFTLSNREPSDIKSLHRQVPGEMN